MQANRDSKVDFSTCKIYLPVLLGELGGPKNRRFKTRFHFKSPLECKVYINESSLVHEIKRTSKVFRPS